MKQNVEPFIEMIRDERFQDALETLNADPFLATSHAEQPGQFHGVSPLHWAAHRNAVELCERLIELGADVNDSAGNWWLTPLSWAADAGRVETVELLLKHGADVDQDAIAGTTALHAVAMGGSSQGSRDPAAYQRTAEILIAHGACLSGRSERRQTPLDDAIEYENEYVAAVLRAHGAQPSSPAE
ncbi:MAG: ankyrin repeat domain-containing protein [Planctomycetaceae bacterium]|nr:ankyrin repeat domain-containing protein [Planctomycetaceae bacterium]